MKELVLHDKDTIEPRLNSIRALNFYTKVYLRGGNYFHRLNARQPTVRLKKSHKSGSNDYGHISFRVFAYKLTNSKEILKSCKQQSDKSNAFSIDSMIFRLIFDLL